ncbi:hypothetical protein BB558_003573 [Smittium angustum]|nr:hypothetical protein BB558_003573 [Smittium angustum]
MTDSRPSQIENNKPSYSNSLHSLLNDDSQSDNVLQDFDSIHSSNKSIYKKRKTSDNSKNYRPIKMISPRFDSNMDIKPGQISNLIPIEPRGSQNNIHEAYNEEQTETEESSHNNLSNRHPVGSFEWQRVRKENHKQVERRRREHINAGVNMLSNLVPGCEKNKGKVLHQAADYINQLKINEVELNKRWIEDNQRNSKTIDELTKQIEKLKNENFILTQKLESTSSRK